MLTRGREEQNKMKMSINVHSLANDTALPSRTFLLPTLPAALPPMMFFRPTPTRPSSTMRRHTLPHQHTSPSRSFEHIIHTLDLER